MHPLEEPLEGASSTFLTIRNLFVLVQQLGNSVLTTEEGSIPTRNLPLPRFPDLSYFDENK